MKLTALLVKVPEGYVAFIAELPGANTQGATLDEARENLHEAVALVLAANRDVRAIPRRGHCNPRDLVLPSARSLVDLIRHLERCGLRDGQPQCAGRVDPGPEPS